MGLIKKLFGTYSDKELKKIYPVVDKIEAMEPAMEALSDEQLKDKTREFKERLEQGETLDDLLPEAFAVVREAAKRVLGMRPFRVQIIGGIVLHEGRIAEMKTGEGKTLVSTMPAYLNALTGKGVHIVTVNDYLAARDAAWMGQVHEFLGLKVGVILNSLNSEERKEAYNCDITYATNNELGFDYLRDNMVIYEKNLVQRGLNYAIIDEVDSVLIDEARTPLIISGQSGKSTDLYKACDILAKQLIKGTRSGEMTKMAAIMGEQIEETGDFIVDEKEKSCSLTDEGVKKVEQFFHLENLADADNLDIQHNIILALRANYLMFRDKDYVVKDEEVLIVDEFTGRIMPGRRYSDGLHQAIEAKEGVKVRRESKTLATITFQNFFNKYEKKAGMTGTALTEEQEFREIYGMDVVAIPTNKPVIRVDEPDSVYKTHKEKVDAVVKEVQRVHATGQPVLVGTITIDASEEISARLTKAGIKHNVLNAKFHEMEADIIKDAGQMGAVTIATNMAGRGTDIVLGEGVTALGGLRIVGTERHESRRIDNQLRGRAGRQGDPGSSKFFIALDDNLMRIFGSERMVGMFNALGFEEGEAIEHKMLTNAIERAQEKVEFNNFGIRKNLMEYDRVNNEQREVIYAERRKVLEGEDMTSVITRMRHDTIRFAVDRVIENGMPREEWDLKKLYEDMVDIVPLPIVDLTPGKYDDYSREQLIEELQGKADRFYKQKDREFPDPDMLREGERVVLLKVIDRRWMNHIDDMEQLRQGIGLQAMGQRDPVVEYRFASYDMFDELIAGISEETTKMLMHLELKQPVEREQVAKVTGTNKDDSGPRTPKKRANQKIYPNDPCPCGSGLKYKLCHGKKQ